MKKLIGKNSIFLIGRAAELRLQLFMIEDKNMTLADYIKAQATAYRNSLN